MSDQLYESKNNLEYAGVLDRVKAVTADSLIIVLFLIIFTYLFESIGNVTDNARKMALIFIFILYDPIFVSLFGGTIGHMAIGLRVKREKNPERNIIFPLALVRFIVKALLGWVSLLSISGNEKKKAIHDIIVESIVIYKKND